MAIGGLRGGVTREPPLRAFDVYFVEPLTQGWSLQEIAVKATPLVLIALGLSFCYRANLWNIGAEGQFIFGGSSAAGSGFSPRMEREGGHWILPAMMLLGALGGVAYALVPALLGSGSASRKF